MDRISMAKRLMRVAQTLDETYERTGDEKLLRLANSVTAVFEKVLRQETMVKAAQLSQTPYGSHRDFNTGYYVDPRTGLPTLQQGNEMLSQDDYREAVERNPEYQRAVHRNVGKGLGGMFSTVKGGETNRAYSRMMQEQIANPSRRGVEQWGPSSGYGGQMMPPGAVMDMETGYWIDRESGLPTLQQGDRMLSREEYRQVISSNPEFQQAVHRRVGKGLFGGMFSTVKGGETNKAYTGLLENQVRDPREERNIYR